MAELDRTPGEPAPQDRAADATTTETHPAHAVDASVDATSADTRSAERHDVDRTAPPVPPAPADTETAPPAQPLPAAPKRRSNRVAGTAWVLLAAGLYQVLYFLVIGLLVLPVGGVEGATRQVQLLAATPFAWLPVLLFFLLYELVVLLFNRAGRFFYVVASLVVAALTYAASVLLISILLRGEIGDSSSLTQAFESLVFILIGIVAREVMLWTGFAIGARGKRLRIRNRQAKQAYRDELKEARDAG